MEWKHRNNMQKPLYWAMRFEIWTVAYIWEKEDPSQSSDLEKVQELKLPSPLYFATLNFFYVL
jgi:hypothetical protein